MSILDTNAVEVSGTLVRAPHYFEINKIPVCRLWVAVKGKSKTDCINVVVLGVDAEMCEIHLERDREVAVDGELNRYLREAVDDPRECVFIVAGSVRGLGGRSPSEPSLLTEEDGTRVDFVDLPSEVQTLISERVAELTDEGQ
jgi:single-stranded DNA-binding protein